uniref:cDNA clone:J023084M13, full insert sequence n=2 Tax=Oryza sativa subsp. japonica TaxID=39947 RepID=Q5VSC6_ORYSJ|nr:uncharacterized protein LOC4340077 isoform X1 [Oryza sativa Japonica Group]BAD67651.1 unknown protein [Oryza sativa Japonica Group]BAH00356.1 unnamed protein product [Oryza sativa Japonica Group]
MVPRLLHLSTINVPDFNFSLPWFSSCILPHPLGHRIKSISSGCHQILRHRHTDLLDSKVEAIYIRGGHCRAESSGRHCCLHRDPHLCQCSYVQVGKGQSGQPSRQDSHHHLRCWHGLLHRRGEEGGGAVQEALPRGCKGQG